MVSIKNMPLWEIFGVSEDKWRRLSRGNYCVICKKQKDDPMIDTLCRFCKMALARLYRMQEQIQARE